MKRTAQDVVANIIRQYGLEPTMQDVASYVYEHYNEVTGMKKSERDAEGWFPEEVLAVTSWFEKHYGHSFDDFQASYGN